jgi:hypothetical protein
MEEAARGRPEFLSTHPSQATRIKQIEAWLPEAWGSDQTADGSPERVIPVQFLKSGGFEGSKPQE